MVINMPERDISREMYNPDNYAAYLETVKSTFGPDVPFLDLRLFLQSNEFHDLEHSVVAGSIRLTDEIILQLKKRLINSPPALMESFRCLQVGDAASARRTIPVTR